jgi:outer membrane protein TolC
MERIALLTHTIAIEKKAREIGNAVLSLQNREKLLALQKKRLEQAQYFITYQRAKGDEAQDPMELAKAEHEEKRILADIEKTEASIDSQLLAVKVQIGLDPERRLHIDPVGLNAVLASDRASSAAPAAKNSWETIWQQSPEAEIFKLALDLHDYDILASWTGYLPGIAWDVYTANPKSAYATYTGDEDIFLGINFTMPLLDWGERERAVQSSRLEKLRESKRAEAARTGFAANWRAVLQDYKAAAAACEATRNNVAAVTLNERQAVLQHKSGQVDFSVVENIRKSLYDEELVLLERERMVALSEWSVWLTAGNFRQRYFGS